MEEYAELLKIHNWQAILHDSFRRDFGPLFELDGLYWQSVAHYAEARRLAMTPREWDSIKPQIIAAARRAKFLQNVDCAEVLKLTGEAILVSRSAFNTPTVYENELMELRRHI